MTRGGRFRPNTSHQMSAIDAARFAGFFDGEGSVYSRPRYCRISIVNTVRAELEWCQHVTGVGYIYEYEPERTAHAGRKPAWVWKVNCAADIVGILEQIIPLLITKRAIAEYTVSCWKPRLEAAA
jgi:hypothetical protein